MSDLTRNVINQMTTSVNLLSVIRGMSLDTVADSIHDEIVINVSEPVIENPRNRAERRHVVEHKRGRK